MADDDDICIRIGRRLRKLRKQRGWTQVQMAEEFGLDRSYLADVEHGKRNVSARNLEVIASGFGLTLSRFFSKI
jgi:transcriptional regulator with XRE-family HTH domain